MNDQLIPGLSPQDILLSKRIDNIVHKPFCVFQSGSYFEPEVYEKLRDNFPTEDKFVTSTSAGDLKIMINSHFNQKEFDAFMAESPIWKQFTEAFNSDVFVKDAWQYLKDDIIRAHGKVGQKPWRLHTATDIKDHEQPIEVQFHFSRIKTGAQTPPHTDAVRKLGTMLMYFPSEDWQEEWGGSTQFYRPKYLMDNFNYGNCFGASFDDMTVFAEAKFTPNRVGGFIKSRHSWHGVLPVKLPEGVSRRALFIQFVATDRSPDPTLAEKIEFKINKLVRTLTQRDMKKKHRVGM